MSSERSLRDLTLRYSALYLALVVVTAILGGGAVAVWQDASQESLRVTGMVQEVEAMRGNLYRQMKELFDTTFLDDPEAQNQYQLYSGRIDDGLRRLAERALGSDEQAAVRELKRTYHEIHTRTDAIVFGPIPPEGRVLQRIFDTDLETGGLQAYEAAFQQVDRLFLLQQERLQHKLGRLASATPLLLAIPMLAACALLVLTRRFLNQSVVDPFSRLQAAARVLAAGDLSYRLPREGAREIAELAETINRMAEELQQSRAAVLRAERQATLGALVPVVAHNIRNPLASIRATAQVIDDESLLPDIREGLRGIIKSTDRLERWTASLLSYLHPLEARRVPADPGTMLDELLDLVQPQFDVRAVVLERRPRLPLPLTLFDPELLEQALHALIMNALEASARGGMVEVGMSVRDGRLETSICDQGPGLQWSVGASGLPRAPVVSGRTTKRTGTGLGIPFALKVSEVHDGGLRYLMRPAGGTEALFWIPCP
jgi:signal transduction histidine kinase